MPTDSYLFGRRLDLGGLEHLPLTALAELFDRATRRFLDHVGVARGWCCLEVAAGTGSVAAWMGDRVGPSGRVLATDVDLSHLARLNDDVRPAQHDRVSDSLPDGAFDLVHTRLAARLNGARRPSEAGHSAR